MAALLNILCVDDDPDILVIIAVALGLDRAMSVQSALSGQDALSLLADSGYNPDCLLLDMHMPGGGGLLIDGIRRLPGKSDTPIIFLTAGVRTDEIARHRSLGAIGTIAKPFDPLQLAEQIREMLGNFG